MLFERDKKTKSILNAVKDSSMNIINAFVTVENVYDGKKEQYNVCEGMPVLATRNIKDNNVFNTMQFVIEQINNNSFLVNNEWYDKEEFQISYINIPAFCVTVYKIKVRTSTNITIFMMPIAWIKSNYIQQ